MSKQELKFASTKEAMQHLANITGKKVKVAADDTYSDDTYEELQQMHKDYLKAAKEANEKLWEARSKYADLMEEIEEGRKNDLDPKKAEALEIKINNNDFVKTLKTVFKDNLI